VARSAHRLVLGQVTAFDEAAGLGQVEAVTGERFGFHCTAIAGGGRSIAVGARVAFRVTPGAPGRWEASEVIPTDAPKGSSPVPKRR
jgi:cold shock CspA family protein